MQHYISTLPSSTLLWNTSANYQYISQHSKPQHDEYLTSRIQNGAIFRGPLEWDQLHHLFNIPSVPIDQLYKHMINSNGPIIPFISTNESIDDTISLWTLFSHTGIYITGYRIADTWRIRDILLLLFLVPTCQISMPTLTIRFLMLYYCEWWCRGIYKCDGKAGQPITRPCENYDLCMKWESTQMESWQKQQAQSKAVPTSGSLDRKSKIQWIQWVHMVCCQS